MIPAPLLDEIAAAPHGRQTVAFFDMDGTLVSGFTAFAFALERMKKPAASDIGVGAVALRYQLGRAEFVELLEASTRALAGTSVDEVSAVAESVYRNQIASWVYPEARTIIANHRARGHRVVLVSAANDFQVRHVAEDLDVAVADLDLAGRQVLVDRALRPRTDRAGDPEHVLAADVDVVVDDALHDAGQTIIMVTHDAQAAEYAKRTLHCDKGTLEAREAA